MWGVGEIKKKDIMTDEGFYLLLLDVQIHNLIEEKEFLGFESQRYFGKDKRKRVKYEKGHEKYISTESSGG